MQGVGLLLTSATSRGVVALATPSQATSGLVSQNATTSLPAARKFRAMACPTPPIPTRPILGLLSEPTLALALRVRTHWLAPLPSLENKAANIRIVRVSCAVRRCGHKLARGHKL